MSRRARVEEERSMDSLMDAMTNVVGILLLILIISSLSISDAVRKVVENMPEISEEQLAEMKVSRDKTLKNLQELSQTQANTLKNLPTKDEATQLASDLKEFEENNKGLADKTSDIEEWQKKVEEEKATKIKREIAVLAEDKKDKELAAILAQTPEAVTFAAKEVKMPNPRVADPGDTAFYLICKNQRLYYIGDPYVNALKIRDVIDNGFSDLAYTGKEIGSYTYSIKGTKKHKDGYFLPLKEDYRLTRSKEKALAAWEGINTKWSSRDKKPVDDASVMKRLFGSADKKEFTVQKFRYDLKKITTYFGKGKLGPKDFSYAVYKGGGDRVKFAVVPREEAGWTADAFMKPGSEFEKLCKSTSANRRSLFYYYVAPDSFDVYLQARGKSEDFRIPAGWNIWDGDKLELQAVPRRTTLRYNLDSIPKGDYMKLANAVGPAMVENLNKELSEFDVRVSAAVPKEITKPEEIAAFIAKLSEERREWNVARFQPYAIAPFQTALAAQELKGTKEVQIEIHPPEIPHIRVFAGANPPKVPKPEVVVDPKIGAKPGNGKQPAGGNTLILD